MTERSDSIVLHSTFDNRHSLTCFPHLRAGKVYGHHFRYALLLHRDSEQHVGKFHGAFVVGNDDNLGILTDDLQQVIEAEDIGIIQGCIDFIQQAKRCRFD